MTVIIQSPHQRISAKTRQVIEEKFERFNKMMDRIEQCHIVLKKEKNNKQETAIVEARLVIPGNDLFAREQAGILSQAAELVCIDLENQIRKQKEKANSKHVKPVDELVAEGEE